MLEFYHVTARKNLSKIAKEGLREGSFWASGDLAGELVDYYKETVEDEEETPVILRVFIDDVDQNFFKPDMPGLEEPITTVVGKSEKTVWSDWEASSKTWQACVDMIGSCKYSKTISANCIYVEDDDNVIKLTKLFPASKSKIKA